MISAKTLHGIAVTAFVGLVVLMLSWLLWLYPPADALMPIALITLLGPLALTARGVLYGRRYTVAWSAIFVLIYFIHGVTYAAVPGPERWLGIVEIVLAVVYFTAALMYLRQAGSARPGSRERTGP
ncbi:DUF2069 domain-containing protein [Halorhodospira halophila]|uniref:Putative transmembrane protein n=1 Tax=Halorhodospira halophila (strain DSM 244 / SL1) TaxID=349124 RepID=A1WUX6_HALHL|nr:DUF2069 domain-containing protein [Halorhodospira halophila]ABM61488.1 putative transmembrane protein [Halorhodospira halophila SL1]MBK1728736.1 DUF2069 domain-containing protein [Halorhodospira halophila]